MLETQNRITKECNDRSLKNYQCSTEGQNCHEILAPVLAIISGSSLVLSTNIFTSIGFYLVSL